MNGADGVYRAHPRIHATHRGSDCNPAGYKSKFPLERSSTFHCSAVSFARDILSEIAQCCRNLSLAAERRFQPVAGFVRWSLNLWCSWSELNHRHLHFQCSALPTELPGRRARRADEEERGVYRGSIPGCPEQPVTLAIHVPDVSSPGFAADFPSS